MHTEFLAKGFLGKDFPYRSLGKDERIGLSLSVQSPGYIDGVVRTTLAQTIMEPNKSHGQIPGPGSPDKDRVLKKQLHHTTEYEE